MTCKPISVAFLMTLILIIDIGMHSVYAHRGGRGPHGGRRPSGGRCQKVIFFPVTTPATDETCATDYEERDTNELEELPNRGLPQEVLEVSVCFYPRQDTLQACFQCRFHAYFKPAKALLNGLFGSITIT